VADIELDTNDVIAGQTARGTVTLASAAPTGGVAVTLTSSDITRATVPATVIVAAGQTSATFTVTTVASSPEAVVTISAFSTGDPKSVSFSVLLPGVLARLELETATISGGQSVRATVSLTSPAAEGGVPVALSSNNELAAVPATIAIAAGQSNATFTVTTRASSRDVEVTITATAAGSTRTARLAIVEARLTAFEVNPTSISGGLPVRGTASFSGPHSNPTLRMTSSNTAVVPSATVQLSPTSNSFSILTRSTMAERAVTLSVDCCGAVRSTTLRVLPMLFQFQVPQSSPMWGEPNVVDLTTRRFSGVWNSRNTGRENLVTIMMLLPGATPGGGTDWTLVFAAPNNGRLSPGFYRDTRWTLEAGSGAGLDVWSPRDVCLQTTGQFEIFEAVYGPPEPGTIPAIGSIERFHAVFQRTCNFDANRVIAGEISVSALPSTPR
jgi:hypothetical protein